MIKKRKHREWLKSSGPEKTKSWQSEKTVGTAIETRRLYTVFCTTEVTRREWLRLWCTTEVSRREWSAVCWCVLSCTTVYYCILLCTTRTVYCNIRLRSAVCSGQCCIRISCHSCIEICKSGGGRAGAQPPVTSREWLRIVCILNHSYPGGSILNHS